MKLIYSFDIYELDLDRATLKQRGKDVKIEPQVFSLLAVLVQHHGEMISREMLIHEVWQDRSISNSVIDSRISSARQAIGDDGKSQRLIKTFTHQGFKFVGAVVENDAATEGNISGRSSSRRQNRSHRKIGRKTVIASIAGGFTCIAAIFILTNQLNLSPPYGDPRQRAATNSSQQTDKEQDKLSIAVLPVISRNDNPQAVVYSTIIAEESLSFLSDISDLTVVSRSSSFAFRDRELSAPEINEALNVDYRLESRCSTINEQVAVTVQLIRTDDEVIVWSKRYEGSTTEPENIEQQINVARNVSQNVTNLLGVSASAFSPKIISSEAYRRYADGLAQLKERTPESIARSVVEFEAVISMEPDFLPAYAHLFDAYWLGIKYGGIAHNVAIPDMQKLQRRMQTLGPETPETLTVQALNLQIDGEDRLGHEKALTLLKRATEAGPNYARAREEYAHALLGAHHYRAAAEAFDTALLHDPVSADMLAGATMAQYSADNFDEAFSIARKNIRWNSDHHIAKIPLAHMLLRSNQKIEAHTLLSEAYRQQPENQAVKLNLTALYLLLGLYDSALSYAPTPPYKAYVSAIMGDDERARTYAAELPDHYFSQRALYLIGESEPAYNFLTREQSHAAKMWEQRDLTHVSIVTRIIEARLFREHDDPRSQSFIFGAKQYFENRPISEFQTINQFTGAIGYYILINDLDTAMAVLDEANERKFVFVYVFNTPLFQPITSHPGFQARLDQMQKNAAAVIRELKDTPQAGSKYLRSPTQEP